MARSLNIDVIGLNYMGPYTHSIVIGTSSGIADVKTSGRVGYVKYSQRNVHHNFVCSATIARDVVSRVHGGYRRRLTDGIETTCPGGKNYEPYK